MTAEQKKVLEENILYWDNYMTKDMSRTKMRCEFVNSKEKNPTLFAKKFPQYGLYVNIICRSSGMPDVEELVQNSITRDLVKRGIVNPYNVTRLSLYECYADPFCERTNWKKRVFNSKNELILIDAGVLQAGNIYRQDARVWREIIDFCSSHRTFIMTTIGNQEMNLSDRFDSLFSTPITAQEIKENLCSTNCSITKES